MRAAFLQSTKTENLEKHGNQIPSVDPTKKWRSRSFDELVTIILRFRGGRGNMATVLDVMDLEKNLTSRIEQLEQFTAQAKLTSVFTRRKVAAPGYQPSNSLPPPKDPPQDLKVAAPGYQPSNSLPPPK